MHISSLAPASLSAPKLNSAPKVSPAASGLLEVVQRELQALDAAQQQVSDSLAGISDKQMGRWGRLMRVQVAAGSIHLRTELVSKVAETANASMRRVQQG